MAFGIGKNTISTSLIRKQRFEWYRCAFDTPGLRIRLQSWFCIENSLCGKNNFIVGKVTSEIRKGITEQYVRYSGTHKLVKYEDDCQTQFVIFNCAVTTYTDHIT